MRGERERVRESKQNMNYLLFYLLLLLLLFNVYRRGSTIDRERERINKNVFFEILLLLFVIIVFYMMMMTIIIVLI